MPKYLPHSRDWHFTEAMPKWVSETKADFLFQWLVETLSFFRKVNLAPG